MRKLQADTAHGVYEVAEFESEEIMSEQRFFESLFDCGKDEILCCTVTDKMYDKIQEKYGIKSL